MNDETQQKLHGIAEALSALIDEAREVSAAGAVDGEPVIEGRMEKVIQALEVADTALEEAISNDDGFSPTLCEGSVPKARPRSIEWRRLDKLVEESNTTLFQVMAVTVVLILLMKILNDIGVSSEVCLSTVGTLGIVFAGCIGYRHWTKALSTQLVEAIAAQPWCEEALAEIKRCITSYPELKRRHYQKIVDAQLRHNRRLLDEESEAYRQNALNELRHVAGAD